MSKTRGVIVLGHGSRRESGCAPVLETAEAFALRHPEWRVVPAFMEFASPGLAEAIEDLLREAPYREIFVVPLFLALGTHVSKHMPEILAEAVLRHPATDFRLAQPFGADPLLCDIMEGQIRALES